MTDIINIIDNWFEVTDANDESFIFYTMTQKKYFGSIMYKNDNVFTLRDNMKFGYLNTKTGNYTGLVFDRCSEFKDGVGVVCKSLGGDDFILDENFKIIMSNADSDMLFYGFCGEGVIKDLWVILQDRMCPNPL